MRRLVLALASIALLGCGSDSSTGPTISAQGTWNLQTVDGSPLPYTTFLQSAPVLREEILSDQYVLNMDGTYTEAFTTRETQGTTVTTSDGSDNGTWTQAGNTVHITSADPNVGSINGTMNSTGDKVTVNVQGFLLVYVKQ